VRVRTEVKEEDRQAHDFVVEEVRVMFGTVMFFAGWVWAVWQSGGDECGSAWNPLVYWRMSGELLRSPWTWGSPEMQEALRESRREICVVSLVALGTAGAYVAGGPGAALTAATAGARLAGGRTAESFLTSCGAEPAVMAGLGSARKRRQRRQRALEDPEGEDEGQRSLVPVDAAAPPPPLLVD
jgi:hypothetical protein